MPHDTGNCTAAAICAARAHVGCSVKELSFADWFQFGRHILPVHRLAFNADRSANVVPGGDITKKIEQEVRIPDVVPEMVVRVDDWQFRFDYFLLMHGQPLRPDRQVSGIGRVESSAHGFACEVFRVIREQFFYVLSWTGSRNLRGDAAALPRSVDVGINDNSSHSLFS